MAFISRGFHGRPRQSGVGLIPPGQYVTDDFPVLTAGQTPKVPLETWDFTIMDQSGTQIGRWSWDEFQALPREEITVDISCVTKWTKLGTKWTGVSLDTLLAGISPDAHYALAFAEPDYTTNFPIADLRDGKAWVAFQFDGKELAPEHGGPGPTARSSFVFLEEREVGAGNQVLDNDQPGFWESLGYNNYGDPWREQRYQGD